MKYGFCLQGRERKVRQQFPPKYCVTPRAIQIPQGGRPRYKHSVHWKKQIKIREFPVVVVVVQGTEQIASDSFKELRNLSRVLHILRSHNHLMYLQRYLFLK